MENEKYFLFWVQAPTGEIPDAEIVLSRSEKVHWWGWGKVVLTRKPLSEIFEGSNEVNEIFSGSFTGCVECFFINDKRAFRIGNKIYADEPGKIIGKKGESIKRYCRFTNRKFINVVSVDEASCEALASAANLPLVKEFAEGILFDHWYNLKDEIERRFTKTTLLGEKVSIIEACEGYKIKIKTSSGEIKKVWPDELGA